MRNFTRFLALALSILMLCGMIAMHANAADAGDYTDAANRLAAVGILKGDKNGNLMLNSEVKRWHTALFFMQIMTGITDANELNAVKESSIFTDVPEYGTAIDQAYGFGVVRGKGDGIYGYNDNIIYQDMLVMAVRALGYETKDMSYPYGHITAANKLGITKNIAADVMYTDALTRGETAQIMWNTLNTEIAYEDPISGKIIYPDEPIPTESIFNKGEEKLIKRETYLERSKFTQGELEVVIKDVKEGKLAADPFILVVDYTYADGQTKKEEKKFEINAKDLGITKYTDKCDYLGLPITLFVDCAAKDFASKYDIVAEDSEAKIVLADKLEFKNVQNLATNGNIKYYADTDANDEKNDAYYMIDGTKFASDKYTVDARVFTEDGWVDDDGLFEESFVYDKKDGYVGKNSYGEIYYTVITEGKDQTLLILYMPYSFGLYAMRSITYQPLSAPLDLVVIGEYDRNANDYRNILGVLTNFVEYTLGENRTVIDNTKDLSVSEKAGEKSVNVIINGEEATSGDFVFYNYNEVDNILTIGLSCGPLKQARLTGFNVSKETVKIGGTNYDYGFPGAFSSDLPIFSEIDFQEDFIEILEAGKDNVAYATIGNNVAFAININEEVAVNHSYAIISIKPEAMADALGIEVEDYAKKTTTVKADGKNYDLYIKDGALQVAMLDTTDGEWYIQAVTDIEAGDYTIEDDEFALNENLATHISAIEMYGENYTKFANLAKVLPVLNNGIVMYRGATKDGIAIAEVVDAALYDVKTVKGLVDYGKTTTGLVFSDLKPYTNKIKASLNPDVNDGRKTLKDTSIIVIVDNLGNVGVRKGIQTTANNAYVTNGRFYTTTNDLIVLKLTDSEFVYASTADKSSGNGITVKEWAESTASSDSNETYYVTTGTSELILENNGDKDETYTVTISNVFDLREFVKVNSVETVVSKTEANALDKAFTDKKSNTLILQLDNKGNISSLAASEENLANALVAAANLYADIKETDDDTFRTINITSIMDDVSVAATLGSTTLTTDEAIGSIDIVLATINLSSADAEDYDFSNMAYPVEYSKDKYKEDGFGFLKGVSSVAYNADTKYYLYTVSNINDTASVSEPATGKFNDYIINTEGKMLYVPAVDADYIKDDCKSVMIDTVACGQFDETSGTLTVYMLKFIKDYAG